MTENKDIKTGFIVRRKTDGKYLRTLFGYYYWIDDIDDASLYQEKQKSGLTAIDEKVSTSLEDIENLPATKTVIHTVSVEVEL